MPRIKVLPPRIIIGKRHSTFLNAHGNPTKHHGDFDIEMASLKPDQSVASMQFPG